MLGVRPPSPVTVHDDGSGGLGFDQLRDVMQQKLAERRYNREQEEENEVPPPPPLVAEPPQGVGSVNIPRVLWETCLLYIIAAIEGTLRLIGRGDLCMPAALLHDEPWRFPHRGRQEEIQVPQWWLYLRRPVFLISFGVVLLAVVIGVGFVSTLWYAIHPLWWLTLGFALVPRFIVLRYLAPGSKFRGVLVAAFYGCAVLTVVAWCILAAWHVQRATPDTHYGLRPLRILEPKEVGRFTQQFLQIPDDHHRLPQVPTHPALTATVAANLGVVPNDINNNGIDDDLEYEMALDMWHLGQDEMEEVPGDRKPEAAAAAPAATVTSKGPVTSITPTGHVPPYVCGYLKQYSATKDIIPDREHCWDAIYLLLLANHNTAYYRQLIERHLLASPHMKAQQRHRRLDLDKMQQGIRTEQQQHQTQGDFHCVCSAHLGIVSPFVFMGYSGQPSLFMIDPEIRGFKGQELRRAIQQLGHGTYVWRHTGTSHQAETDRRFWQATHFNHSILMPPTIQVEYKVPPDDHIMQEAYGEKYGPIFEAWQYAGALALQKKRDEASEGGGSSGGSGNSLPVELMARAAYILDTLKFWSGYQAPGEKEMLLAQNISHARVSIARQRWDKREQKLHEVLWETGKKWLQSSTTNSVTATVPNHDKFASPRLVEHRRYLTDMWAHCFVHCRGLHQGLQTRRREHLQGQTQPMVWASSPPTDNTVATSKGAPVTARDPVIVNYGDGDMY